MNSFFIRLYLLFITTFFVAHSYSIDAVLADKPQSNHALANPPNNVIQTYGTMAKLSYPSLVHNDGKIHSKLTPLNLNHVYIIYNHHYHNGPNYGSGSVLSFKIDPFESRVIEIKVISAVHVYKPLFKGGLTGKEYLASLKETPLFTLNTLISQKWLFKGDPSGVISPSVIKSSTGSLEQRGWNIDAKYITNVAIPDLENKTAKDIIVVTYSNETGLNSEEISDKWKSFTHYNYEVAFLKKSPVSISCEVTCPVRFAGFGAEGYYKDSAGNTIQQPTIFNLVTPKYAYQFNTHSEDIVLDVKDLSAEKLDPYTGEPATTTKDIEYDGYSGSTALIPKGTLGILYAKTGGLFETTEIKLVPFQTSDTDYYKWLMANVNSTYKNTP